MKGGKVNKHKGNIKGYYLLGRSGIRISLCLIFIFIIKPIAPQEEEKISSWTYNQFVKFALHSLI
jgi:hypothetical protein